MMTSNVALLFYLTSIAQIVALKICAKTKATKDEIMCSAMNGLPDISQVGDATSAEDKLTRWLHQRIPLKYQCGLRDSGSFKAISDMMAIILGATLFLQKPRLAFKFISASLKMTKQQYGNTEHHVLEMFDMQNRDELPNVIEDERPHSCLVFVHGGAWGSGKPFFYRLAAIGMAELLDVRKVVVVGYPVFPTSSIVEQKIAIEGALNYIEDNARSIMGSSDCQLLLAGHSSGANICSLAILEAFQKGTKLPSMFFGLAGVYDITDHYGWEARRGVHLISPMAAAAGGAGGFDQCSPTRIAERLQKHFAEDNISREEVAPTTRSHFPRTLLLHGTIDSTVPPSSTLKFCEAVKQSIGEAQISVDLIPYGHVDPILDLMFSDQPSKTATSLKQFYNSGC